MIIVPISNPLERIPEEDKNKVIEIIGQKNWELIERNFPEKLEYFMKTAPDFSKTRIEAFIQSILFLLKKEYQRESDPKNRCNPDVVMQYGKFYFEPRGRAQVFKGPYFIYGVHERQEAIEHGFHNYEEFIIWQK